MIKKTIKTGIDITKASIAKTAARSIDIAKTFISSSEIIELDKR